MKDDESPSEGRDGRRPEQVTGVRNLRTELVDALADRDINPRTGRLLSLAELLAQMREQGILPPLELASVQPDRSNGYSHTRTPTVTDAASPKLRCSVVVVPAQPEAGASTAALALAEAADGAGAAVHLIEMASSSGLGGVILAGATEQELGTVAGGWRRGRRGAVIIDRPDGDGRRGLRSELPPTPALWSAEGMSRLTVCDLGPSWPDWWSGLRTELVVLVGRASVPGVTALERLLGQVESRAGGSHPWNGGPALVTVAVIGARRWSSAVRRACGPRLLDLQARGLLVQIPHVRRLEATRPSAALPRAVISAAEALLAIRQGAEDSARPGVTEE